MKERRSLELVLRPVVREGVEGLEHQDLEHQHRVVGRPPALDPARPLQGRLQLRPEQLEVDRGRVTFLTYP
jgi:hypothetical protein